MNRLHHPITIAAGMAISVVALWLAVRGIEWTQTLDAIRKADTEQVGLALALLVAGIFMRAERWRVVIPRRVPRGSAYRATAVGFFFNYVYPARAGDVLKVLSLHRATGQGLARLSASAVIDRLIDVIVLLAATTAVFWLAPELVLGKSLFYVGSAGLIGGVILAFSPIGETLLRRACAGLDSHPERPIAITLRRLAERFLNFRAEMLTGHRQWPLVATSALVAAADYLSVFFLLKTFGWHLPLLAPVAVWAIVSLGAALPSAPAGIGVNQLACILALGIFKIPAADAFAFSLTLQAASFVAILLALLLGFGVRIGRQSAKPEFFHAQGIEGERHSMGTTIEQGKNKAASYWDDHVGQHIDSFLQWDASKPIQMHQWRHITGDPHCNPVTWFWHKYGPFARSASIGCGNGILERSVAGHLLPLGGRITGFDISPVSIDLARSLSANEGADFAVRDLNQDSWEDATYDAVFAHGALHHVEALDFCVGQIAKALKPEGLLYVNDYLGPARFQFSDTQLRLAHELLLRVVPEKFRSKNVPKRCDPIALSHMDPSEAVNSHQIYETIRAHFRFVERYDTGGTLLAPIFGGGCLDPAIIATSEGLEIISMLAETERKMIDEGLIRSDHLLLVCRKR